MASAASTSGVAAHTSGAAAAAALTATSASTAAEQVAAMSAAAATAAAANATMNNGRKDTTHSDVQKLQQQLNDIKEQVLYILDFLSVDGFTVPFKKTCFFASL